MRRHDLYPGFITAVLHMLVQLRIDGRLVLILVISIFFSPPEEVQEVRMELYEKLSGIAEDAGSE